jgi:protein-L-isoaspartate(D-aspartate) O-methyltransferase
MIVAFLHSYSEYQDVYSAFEWGSGMKQRPSFPVRLDSGKAQAAPQTLLGATRVVTPKLTANAKTLGMVSPSGVGLDSSTIRARMVQKLADQGIDDAVVLKAMGHVERHRFVDSALVNQAYEDTSLPIGLGQTISKPNVVARMIALLRAAPGLAGLSGLGRVLEIGTGCGYQAAVLACVAREVYSIERLRGLHDKARENLRPLRLPNVHLIFGDGMLGYAQGAPYSAIISAAGGENVPQAWTDQLAMGGRLVAPTLTSSGQQALLVIDKTPQGLQPTLLEAVNFVPLKSGIA